MNAVLTICSTCSKRSASWRVARKLSRGKKYSAAVASWKAEFTPEARRQFERPERPVQRRIQTYLNENVLARDIRAELDESQFEKFHGTVSLPFEAGDNRKVAVKIVDDRGIESLKVNALD